MRRAKTRILLDPKWPLLDRNSRRYREKGQPGAESGKSRMMVGATVGRGRQGQASKREFAEGAGVVVPCQPVAAVASTQASPVRCWACCSDPIRGWRAPGGAAGGGAGAGGAARRAGRG